MLKYLKAKGHDDYNLIINHLENRTFIYIYIYIHTYIYICMGAEREKGRWRNIFTTDAQYIGLYYIIISNFLYV